MIGRKDKLQWDIAGPYDPAYGREFPSTLSELTWEDIYSVGAGVSFKGSAAPRGLRGRKGFFFYGRGEGYYGLIVSGDNQDSDYFSDNRQDEFSRSNNKSKKGSVWDLSLAGGVQYRYTTERNVRFMLSPVVGYSINKQNLTMTDGKQTIATDGFTPPLGNFPGLDSTYDAKWSGPFVGLDLGYTMGDNQNRPRFELSLSGEYHWPEYEAEADWNLRDDFTHPVSFEQSVTRAEGYKVKGGVRHYRNRRSSFGLDFSYTCLKGNKGTDKTFFTDNTYGLLTLNNVRWESWSLLLTWQYQF